MPWNHVEDMAGIFAFAVQNQLDGVYNSVAPKAASQQDIYKAISNELNLNSPQTIQAFRGQHLVSKSIQEKGFVFKFPEIEGAIHNLLQNQ